MSDTLRQPWELALREPARHVAQLHGGPRFLVDAIVRFVAAGLARGERAVVIASPAHRDAVAAALPAFADHVAHGRMTIVDADAMIAELAPAGGRIERARFAARLAPLVRGRVRVCSELWARLWAAGRDAEAIELERWWAELGAGGELHVLCGHPLDVAGRAGAALDVVAAVHDHVLPSERALDESPVAQLARLACLELRDRTLTDELAAHLEDEVFLRAIVEQSRDCIKVLDLDGRLQFISKEGLNTLEIVDFGPLRGSNWLAFWDGDDRVRATAAVGRACAGEVGEFIGCFRLVRSKRPRWFHVVVSPIRDVDGQVSSLLAVSRDVTEQKKLDDALRRAIAVRDEFLSIASHELRTPITSLAMQLDGVRRKLAHDGAVTPERLGRLLDVARRQTARLVALVDSMLDVSRLRDGRLVLDRAPTDLADLVCGVVERFRDELAAAGSSVALELRAGLTGRWDRSRLEQVVENLLSNALRYAPGSRIEVAVDGDDREARLVVRDHGPGIPPDQRERVFERFERCAPRDTAGLGGLGLGLYISREIARAHGGTIRVDDAVADGAALVVELPRADGAGGA